MKAVKIIIQLLIALLCYIPVYLTSKNMEEIQKAFPEHNFNNFIWQNLSILLACLILAYLLIIMFGTWFEKKLNELQNGKKSDQSN